VFCRSLLPPFFSFVWPLYCPFYGFWLSRYYFQTLTNTIITKAKTNGRDKLVAWPQTCPRPGDASILHTRWKCHLSEGRCCTEHWVFLLNFIHKTHKLLYVLKRYHGFYHHFKKSTKMSKIFFLSMCDVKLFLTFVSLGLVLLWQLFYLFCSSIAINTVIVTSGTFEP
jgi:hypothetical protein